MSVDLVFVNVGWMVHYAGPRKNDPTLGGHGWLKNHRFGLEGWNFAPHKGKLYGYIPGKSKIDIRNLGATKEDDRVEGITIVWLAKSPRDGKTYIAGWYRNATVHRSFDLPIRRSNGNVINYQIEAPADVQNFKLLEPDQRVVRAPTAKVKGNLGQSSVWYGNPVFVKTTKALLAYNGVLPKPAIKGAGKQARAPKQPDPLERKRIEQAAVRHATKYYESPAGGGRIVHSVETDNCGWDLTVVGASVELFVEVKGLSGKTVCVELTPNEYAKMRSAQFRQQYVIYVVTQAGTPGARAHIFYYDMERSKSTKLKQVWTTQDGRRLEIKQLTGARLTSQ